MAKDNKLPEVRSPCLPGNNSRRAVMKHLTLFPGGNDEPARKTGATCIKVRDPDETSRMIEAVIACVGG
jgi:hypothetical protein